MVRKERGQSVVEFAIILPFLVMLIVLMIETGFALRSYLVITSANREGIRFAARGRYSDELAAARIVQSAGMVRGESGPVPFLQATGEDSNAGIIIRRIPIRADGTLGEGRIYCTGTITIDDSKVPISEDHSRVDPVTIADEHADITVQVNNMRRDAGYDVLDNELVVVEVFYVHRTLWVSTFLPRPFGATIPLYSRSIMRIVSDSRQAQ